MINTTHYKSRTRVIVIFLLVTQISAVSMAQGRTWRREDVNLRAGNGRRIKAIHYPEGENPRKRSQSRRADRARSLRKKQLSASVDAPSSYHSSTSANPTASIQTMHVDSPPIEGFVPWIAVTVTKEHGTDMDFEAVPERSVVGRFPAGVDPDRDYGIGIFDTGAGVHLMGYENATLAGVYSNQMVTSNVSTIGGATASVDTYVSYPLGLFIDGLGAIDPNTLVLDRSAMKGQSNVAIAVGQQPAGRPDLPTAIGAPMAVYYTAVIYNDRPLTITRDNEEYTSPDIILYNHGDPETPSFANRIPLELRPLGGISVQYIPSLDALGGGGGLDLDLDLDDILGSLGGLGGGGGGSDFTPSTPSLIMGTGTQSLFFVHSVDLKDEGSEALDRTRFMLDTGAQVTVIGSRIAARLRLNTNEPEFEVEIEDVTGTVTLYPGFYIDTLDIPALGEWLSASQVPVVLIDISSAEGGSLDGIIGMNLFREFNLILRGSGLVMGEEPALEFESIYADKVPADVTDE
jgi:hypothetical protein